MTTLLFPPPRNIRIHSVFVVAAVLKYDLAQQFLTRLSTLLSTTHSSLHGSVFLTQKCLPVSGSENNDASSSPSQPSSDPSQLPTSKKVLIRATDGKSKPHRQAGEKKEKLSTIV